LGFQLVARLLPLAYIGFAEKQAGRIGTLPDTAGQVSFKTTEGIELEAEALA